MVCTLIDHRINVKIFQTFPLQARRETQRLVSSDDDNDLVTRSRSLPEDNIESDQICYISYQGHHVLHDRYHWLG